jgi:signal transduction histidine kinase
MFRRNSLILRILLLCTALVAVTVGMMGAAIVWIFTLSSQRILDNHLMAYTDIIVSRIKVDGATVTLQDDSGVLARLPRYWQVSENGKPLFRSQNLADALPLKPENIDLAQRLEWQGAHGQDVVAVQSTFLFPKGRKITLTSGLDRAVAEAYRLQERDELVKPLIRVLAAGAFVLAGMTMLLLWVALRPVARIRHALQQVRAGQAERLTGDYPAEIADLADDINRLLDFNAGTVARHREYAGNLAHSLKTPLTVIANEPDIKVVREKLRGIGEIIDRSLARAHASGSANLLGARTPVLPVLQDIADGFGKLYAKQVTVECAPEIVFAGDGADLFEIAGSIIENACKFSARQVKVSGTADAIIVEDDGPGIPEADRDRVLARGARLDESKAGTGIGLAVARDVAALYGGSLVFETSPLGGLKALIKLPFLR